MEATICLNTHRVSVVRQPRTFFDEVFIKYCGVLLLLYEKVHTKSTYKYIQNLKSHRDSQTKKARILNENELFLVKFDFTPSDP